MAAKEMFEKLGYEYSEHDDFIECIRNEQDEYNRRYADNITFWKSSKTISFDSCFDERYGSVSTIFEITLEELQAINKQVEELGW